MNEKEEIETLKKRIEVLELKDKEKRKANIWKEVKEKFTKELDNFNWIHIHTYRNIEGHLITNEKSMIENYHVSQAIGTIVRVVLKRKGLVYLEEKDREKAENIARQILEIMEKERKTNEKKVR